MKRNTHGDNEKSRSRLCFSLSGINYHGKQKTAQRGVFVRFKGCYILIHIIKHMFEKLPDLYTIKNRFRIFKKFLVSFWVFSKKIFLKNRFWNFENNLVSFLKNKKTRRLISCFCRFK